MERPQPGACLEEGGKVMANPCSVYVNINASSEDLAVVLEEQIKLATAESRWLNKLLEHIGHSELPARGYVAWYERNEDSLFVQLECKWSPYLQALSAFVDHYDKDAEIIFQAEECGEEIYWTNDPTVSGTVYIDSCLAHDDGRLEELANKCEGESWENAVVLMADFLGISLEEEKEKLWNKCVEALDEMAEGKGDVFKPHIWEEKSLLEVD